MQNGEHLLSLFYFIVIILFTVTFELYCDVHVFCFDQCELNKTLNIWKLNNVPTAEQCANVMKEIQNKPIEIPLVI